MDNSERTNAISQLIKAMYLQDDQIDLLMETFQKQAPLYGKKAKQGNDLEKTKEYVRSEEFIKTLHLSFSDLSLEEMKQLTDLYNSQAMKKVRFSKEETRSLYNALQEAFMA